MGFCGCLVGVVVFLHSCKLVEMWGVGCESIVGLVGRAISGHSMIVVLGRALNMVHL
jgi:hypothetical protein